MEYFSDTSTDDDDARSSRGDFVSSEVLSSGGCSKSNNGSIRSITAIRAASIYSSGLAAKRSISSHLNKKLEPSRDGSDDLMIYPGYILRPGVKPILLHYGLPIKVGNWSFSKLEHHESGIVSECNPLFPEPLILERYL